jgi:hypothetical protein
MAIEESSPGKCSLFATHPKRMGAVAELYATIEAADVRADALRLTGYTVEVTLSKVWRGNPDR